MDIEKLIEAVKLCGSTPKVDQCKQCTYWAGGDMSKCIPRMTLDAATALSTLQAENEKLRAEVESLKKGHCAGCSVPAVKAEQIRDLTDAPRLRAELERVTAERDAAVSDIETALAYGVENCELCANGQCHLRGGTKPCLPKWRGIKED